MMAGIVLSFLYKKKKRLHQQYAKGEKKRSIKGLKCDISLQCLETACVCMVFLLCVRTTGKL